MLRAVPDVVEIRQPGWTPPPALSHVWKSEATSNDITLPTASVPAVIVVAVPVTPGLLFQLIVRVAHCFAARCTVTSPKAPADAAGICSVAEWMVAPGRMAVPMFSAR